MIFLNLKETFKFDAFICLVYPINVGSVDLETFFHIRVYGQMALMIRWKSQPSNGGAGITKIKRNTWKFLIFMDSFKAHRCRVSFPYPVTLPVWMAFQYLNQSHFVTRSRSSNLLR